MPTTLVLTAGNWHSEQVPCTFTVKANNVALTPTVKNPQFFDLPPNTFVVEVTATPTGNTYWAKTVFVNATAAGEIS